MSPLRRFTIPQHSSRWILCWDSGSAWSDSWTIRWTGSGCWCQDYLWSDISTFQIISSNPDPSTEVRT